MMIFVTFVDSIQLNCVYVIRYPCVDVYYSRRIDVVQITRNSRVANVLHLQQWCSGKFGAGGTLGGFFFSLPFLPLHCPPFP